MTAAAPAQPALAAAVRTGQWTEVRALAAAMPRPLPPAVALVVARAAARTGKPIEALRVLRDALPSARDLTAALRLEGGTIALSRGETPWPWVGPLLRGSQPAAHRRAAGDLLRLSWQNLPVAVLRQQRALALPRSLARDLAASLAVRAGDTAAAMRVLRGRRDDEPAVRVAFSLSQRAPVPGGSTLAVAEALLAGGWWREAEALLAGGSEAEPAHLRSHMAYIRGRAAYRLGKLDDAARQFDAALAAADSDDDRFAAAVQRARVAELAGDRPSSVPFWDSARHAGQSEVEGWDGGARARAALGRHEEAVALLRGAPAKVLRVAGPRLAAMLLATGDDERARALLAALSRRDPAVRALWVACDLRAGDASAAVAEATQLLALPGAGAWRSLVLELLPEPASAADGEHPAARDAPTLAAIAAHGGAAAARSALAAALARDPAWAALAAGEPPPEPAWSGPARELAAVGLEHEAADLYPWDFPSGSPAELAWSAARLAEWGNGPAALTTAERLEGLLGDLPHELLPDPLLQFLLPAALTEGCAAAARDAGVPGSWVAAIVRQESRFDVRARSQAGAIGVAQVVPETARRLGARPEELWDADRSLVLAARELARIVRRFGPHLPVVAAAYNAGDEVVASWLAALGGAPGDLLFAAAVPFGETADYALAVRDGAALARYLK